MLHFLYVGDELSCQVNGIPGGLRCYEMFCEIHGPAYQEIMQEGREEGLQEQRLTLLEVVQSRFPNIEPLATPPTSAIMKT